MKKSKLSIGLVTSFIAAMALTACNEVTADDKNIVTFTGYDGNVIEVLKESNYKDYLETSSGISKLYDAILEVLIRNKFENIGFGDDKGFRSFEQIEAKAENTVQTNKDNASTNAKNNGTKYDDEWNTILENNGVEDEEGLKEKFIYQEEKEEIEKWYLERKPSGDTYDTYLDQLTAEFIETSLPYHIQHILVKSDKSNFYSETISQTVAQKLSNIVAKMADGTLSFDEIAKTESDDTSKDSYGDVGIVTNNATSGSLTMVSEFQLGIYAFDAIYGGNSFDSTKVAKLGISDTVKTDMADLGLAKVPYSVFADLGKFAETTTFANKSASQAPTSISEHIYPRNILWNKYLNNHNVFVITNAGRNVGTYNDDDAAGTAAQFETDNLTSGIDSTVSGANFVDGYSFLDSGEKVLTDGKGNVIIGVRSEFGIHFMLIKKSAFADNLTSYYNAATPENELDDTYVNFISGNTTEYNSRISTIKNAVKSFDPTFDYGVYKILLKELEDQNAKIEYIDENIPTRIAEYIDSKAASNTYSQNKNIAKVWEKYIRLLEEQNYERSLSYDDNTHTRLVPEYCITAFEDDAFTSWDEYKEGGKCYYGN